MQWRWSKPAANTLVRAVKPAPSARLTRAVTPRLHPGGQCLRAQIARAEHIHLLQINSVFYRNVEILGVCVADHSTMQRKLAVAGLFALRPQPVLHGRRLGLAGLGIQISNAFIQVPAFPLALLRGRETPWRRRRCHHRLARQGALGHNDLLLKIEPSRHRDHSIDQRLLVMAMVARPEHPAGITCAAVNCGAGCGVRCGLHRAQSRSGGARIRFLGGTHASAVAVSHPPIGFAADPGGRGLPLRPRGRAGLRVGHWLRTV
jgi:hypothetical protein